MRARRVVTTRTGGASGPPYDAFNLGAHVGDVPDAVASNRRRLTRELGVEADHLIWMDQVHSATVGVVSEPADAPVPATDGLVTTTPGLVLAVLAADCVPVLMVEPAAGVAAAAHAGRPGAAAGIALRALETMVGLGAQPARVDVLLGPAVCGACYEVPAEMQAEVEAALPGSASTTRKGTTGLDLRAGLAAQLLAAGVGAVVTDPRCTAEDRSLYSYRRDGTTGRHAGLVWLAE